MSRYNQYQHLLGRKYVDGKQDCYGLLIAYAKDLHGLSLKNFARPTQFWMRKDFDLISQMVQEDRWAQQGLSVRNLQIGDALIFSINSSMANHIGVYVGNGQFLHHLYQRFSSVESLTNSWTSRLLMVVRHKDIKLEYEKVEILNLIPEHVKRTLRIDS